LNTCIGYASGRLISTGKSNSSLGYRSLNECVSGVNNTAIGYQSSYNLTGSYNTSVGFGSLNDNITGSHNTSLGNSSGQHLLNGNYNLFLGATASPSSVDTYAYQYLTLIGPSSSPVIVGQSNQLVLGSTIGQETIYIPNGDIELGTGQINAPNPYTITSSGNNNTLSFINYNSVGNVSIPLSISATTIVMDELTSTTINSNILEILDYNGGNTCNATLNSNTIMTSGNFLAGTGTLNTSGTTTIIFSQLFDNAPIVTATYLMNTSMTQPLNIISVSISQLQINGEASATFSYIAYSATG
jgi:hypothetical protein